MLFDSCDLNINAHGQELRNHGTKDFPVAAYREKLNNGDIAWHWHDELEIVFVEEGQVQANIANKNYILTPETAIFINSGVLHSLKINTNNTCVIRSLVFHTNLIGDKDSLFYKRDVDPILNNKGMPCALFHQNDPWEKQCMLDIFNAWVAMKEYNADSPLIVRDRLTWVLHRLINQNHTVHRPSQKELRNSIRIKQMLQYIQENYSNNITIEDIAESASISVSECLRCFKNSIQISPIQYLKQHRLQIAAELLLSTSLKIIDIGIECGFQEMSYFARSFKDYWGTTPSQYRTQKLNTKLR